MTPFWAETHTNPRCVYTTKQCEHCIKRIHSETHFGTLRKKRLQVRHLAFQFSPPCAYAPSDLFPFVMSSRRAPMPQPFDLLNLEALSTEAILA